ncbi:hypothetical protein [Streptomyces sp. YIM S03343]
MNWYGHSNRYFSSLKLKTMSGVSARGEGSRFSVDSSGLAASRVRT